MLHSQFTVSFLDEQLSALEVLAGLYAKPYRIVHLAGHGHYETPLTPGGKARSGMVLDNGVFLTAVEICQMQQVPELVFLNCCHIGQTGPDTPAPQSTVEFNRLAASVSRELIEMGVRAVVAAGWAVRDDAALHFAKTFYRGMLAGETFGRALKTARGETWKEFPDCNTCAAYQAYGDPDYQLDPNVAGVKRSTTAAHLVSSAEFVEQLAAILRQAQDAERQTRDPERSRQTALDHLEKAVKECPPEWLAQSDVLIALGRTYGELADFEPAIRYLRRALDTGEPDNATTLKAVEQLANFEVRDGENYNSVERISQAIDRLQRLNEFGETTERLALIAAAYKRIAQLSVEPAAVLAAVQQSVRYYHLAHERNVARGVFDPYATLNWLTASALLEQPVAQADALLSRCQIAASERYARTHDPFDAFACIDLQIVRALSSESLSADASSIADRYRETFLRAGASARQIDSVINQLRWMEHVIEKLSEAKTSTKKSVLRQALAEIRTKLAGANKVSSTGRSVTAIAAPGEDTSARSPSRRHRAEGGSSRKTKGGSRRSRQKGSSRRGKP
jgi:tetratricopeptide (TPR) repeat protein